MATLTSQEILNATVSMGVSKANQCWIARAANTLLAGMYIAIGGFLAIRIGLALPWEQWGGMSKLIFGAVFPLGLMLVVLCGADLFTGSCMTLTTAQAKQKISFGNDRQDRGSLVSDDGFRCLGHGALHCQYVFHPARTSDRNRPPLHRISRSREGRST